MQDLLLFTMFLKQNQGFKKHNKKQQKWTLHQSRNVHRIGTYTNECTFLPLSLLYVSTHLQRFCCFSLAFRRVFLRNITNNCKNEGFPRVGTYTEQERFYPFRWCTFLLQGIVHFCCYLLCFFKKTLVFRKVFLRNITNNNKNERFPRVGTYTEQERFYPFRWCTFLLVCNVFVVFPQCLGGFFKET